MTELTRLQKYEMVNSANSLEELACVIESFADENGMIQGRTKKFCAKRMAIGCRDYREVHKNMLTREYGIRQQATYLEYYNKIN